MKEKRPIMLRSLDVSDLSNYGGHNVDLTPCHSTPKSKESLEEFSMNDSRSKSEMELHLENMLRQREHELATVLKAYENLLVLWQKDAKEVPLLKQSLLESMDFSGEKRCSSMLSESSKDSGRHTDSPNNPLQNLAESASVLELVKVLSIQVQKREQELEIYKEKNDALQYKIGELNRELETLKNKSSSPNTSALRNNVRTPIDCKNSPSDQQLEKILNSFHQTNEKLNQELITWKKYYNEARQNIEDLKDEKLKMEHSIANLLKNEDHMRQQINYLKEQLAGNAGKDERCQSAITERQTLHKKFIIALRAIKMLFEKQQNVIEICLSSVSSQDFGEEKQDFAKQKYKTSALMEDLESFLRNFSKSKKPAAEDRYLPAASSSSAIAKNISRPANEKLKTTHSSNALLEGVTLYQKNSLNMSLVSSSDDEYVEKLNRILITSQKMLNMVSSSTYF